MEGRPARNEVLLDLLLIQLGLGFQTAHAVSCWLLPAL